MNNKHYYEDAIHKAITYAFNYIDNFFCVNKDLDFSLYLNDISGNNNDFSFQDITIKKIKDYGKDILSNKIFINSNITFLNFEFDYNIKNKNDVKTYSNYLLNFNFVIQIDNLKFKCFIDKGNLNIQYLG